MQVQQIPRTLVRTGLQAARLPLTAAEAVLRRDERREEWPPALAFDGFQAGVKQIMGSILRDPELVEEGRITQAKVAQLRKAAELDAVAEQHERQADTEYEQRLEADERRRRQVEQQADAREAELERRKARQQAQIEEETRRKAETAKKVDAATKKSVERQERAARGTRVSAEREALAKERKAVAAKAEVVELEAELQSSKAARNGDD
jgi:hypothetical protein